MKGQRVGVGWFGRNCRNCDACRSADTEILCRNLQVTGFHFNGGYGEYMVVPWESTAVVPDGLTDEEAAPLLCAGLTVFNGLRRSVAKYGDLVAVSGIGGLGHLAVQYSHHMGFRTVAISSGSAKEEFARKLGADIYLDSSKVDVAAELNKLGGAKVIVATQPDAESMGKLLAGVGISGQILVAGADVKSFPVSPVQLIPRRVSIQGLTAGNARDAEDTLNFSAQRHIVSVNEVFPHSETQKAFDRMVAGARFRVVIKY